jgi:DNA-binding response OmpR family regulator
LRIKFRIPDIFLIDKQLSGTNGLDICLYLKDHRDTVHLPVIMIPASPDIAQLSEEAGVDSYTEKPFDMMYMLRLIRMLLLKKEQTLH